MKRPYIMIIVGNVAHYVAEKEKGYEARRVTSMTLGEEPFHIAGSPAEATPEDLAFLATVDLALHATARATDAWMQDRE